MPSCQVLLCDMFCRRLRRNYERLSQAWQKSELPERWMERIAAAINYLFSPLAQRVSTELGVSWPRLAADVLKR